MARRPLNPRILRPGAAAEPPSERGEPFEVEAPGLNSMRKRARDELACWGYRVRVISSTLDGIVAYIEVPS